MSQGKPLEVTTNIEKFEKETFHECSVRNFNPFLNFLNDIK